MNLTHFLMRAPARPHLASRQRSKKMTATAAAATAAATAAAACSSRSSAAAALPTRVSGRFLAAAAAAVTPRGGLRKTGAAAAAAAANRTTAARGAAAACATGLSGSAAVGDAAGRGGTAFVGGEAGAAAARARAAGERYGGRGRGKLAAPAACTPAAACRRAAVMSFSSTASTAAAGAQKRNNFWLLRPCRRAAAAAGSCGYLSRAAASPAPGVLRRTEAAAACHVGSFPHSSRRSGSSSSSVAALQQQEHHELLLLLPTLTQQQRHHHHFSLRRQQQLSHSRQRELLYFPLLSHLPLLSRSVAGPRASLLPLHPFSPTPQQQHHHPAQQQQHPDPQQQQRQPHHDPQQQQQQAWQQEQQRSVFAVAPQGQSFVSVPAVTRWQTQQQQLLPFLWQRSSSWGPCWMRLFASSAGRETSSSSTQAAAGAAVLTAEPFLTGTSAAYVEQMFAAWRRDPTAVHASWAAYFSNVQRGLSPGACFSLPPPATHEAAASLLRAETAAAGGSSSSTSSAAAAEGRQWCPYVASAPGSLPASVAFVSATEGGGLWREEDRLSSASQQSVQDTSRLIQMVRGYQLRGHEYAAVNPLDLPRTVPFVSVPHSRSAAAPGAKLDYTSYGFTAADLDRVYDYRVPGMEGFLSAERPPQPLRQLVRRLEEAYCGSIGVEYMHINDREACNFIRKHIETPEKYAFPPAVQQKILARTARAQLFENFCGQRFSTSKRFGLDGCETMIVGLKALTKKAAREGVKSVVIGMPHRGRLNVLVNILHKPMQQLLSEFLGVTKYSLAEWGNSGDVKYHLGVEFDHFDADAQRYIHMGVLPNPSHLEAVDPLVIGQARAQQYYSGDSDCSTVLPVLLHGDASIAGQGVVYETLQMSQLPFYRVGGAIHIVVNNQIGFTTDPVDSCSGRYCTDVAKAFDAPIFHVNADDPEAVTFVSELAFKYRQHFKGDVFIDLIGYRRLGHNELDMPKFTQPAMYTLISKKIPVFDLYAEKLKQQGVVQEADLRKLKESISTFYNSEYEKCKTYLPTQNYEYSPQWKHLVRPDIAAAPRLTGVRVDRLRELGTRLYTLPPNFSVHPTVGKIFKERLNAVQANIDDNVIDFGTAETLCYATLLSDGFHVRVAGQDVQRGTFSHRHAVLHDQANFKPYCIYQSLRGYNFPHEILFVNSLLSEYAAMGYEFGYSLEHPDSLCVWEAQFGDFSNGAQIIIDQFVASGEVKWNKQSGIVLMLPHGYDGQGPEHSSGRIERLLQLCDDREDVIHKENWEIERSSVIQQHNLQVIMPSTPANMFHALRRQVHREFRKPLVIFSPKRMLKMRAAMCALRQLDEGTRFRRYIPDKTAVPEKVRRLIVCSGQVYYDIIAAREKRKAAEGEAEGPGDQIAVARMEQLSPFPFDLFIKDLQQYPNLQTVVWAQEEPMNQGAWFYTSKRIENSLSHLGFPNGIRAPVYAGRDVNATTAVGDKRLHDQEVAQLLEDALDLGRVTHSYLEKYIHKQKEKGGQGSSQEREAQAE